MICVVLLPTSRIGKCSFRLVYVWRSLLIGISGVASVATRSLAIAAESLVSRTEQEEVIQIFDKIREETGWRVAFLNDELKQKWGWSEDDDQSKPPPGDNQQKPSMLIQQQQQPPHQSHHQNMPSNGSTSSMSSYSFGSQSGQQQPLQQPQQSSNMGPMPSMMGKMPKQGIVNPILKMADFSAPVHPYQNYYVPPIQPLVHF